MTKLLSAPCVFCGYNGPNYWQIHSHAKDCLWYDIAGMEERKELLPDLLVIMVRCLKADWKNVQSLQQRLSTSNARAERLARYVKADMKQRRDEVSESYTKWAVSLMERRWAEEDLQPGDLE